MIRTGILRVGVLIQRLALLVLRKERFLDFPVVRLDADRELEIFLGDVVP